MRCKDTEYFGKNRNLSKLMFIGQNKKEICIQLKSFLGQLNKIKYLCASKRKQTNIN